jgi:hypothetical protein
VAKTPGLSELRIPEQKKEKSWFDIRPKQVAAWVETLPLGDTEETTKQLFSVLTHTNRVEIPASARLKALEGLYSTFCFCVDSLKKNFLGLSFPLNARALKYVDRTLAMYAELATAYKIACAELIERNRFYEKKTLTNALYMAMEALGKLQLTYYQIYAPEPAQLWTDIHTLYSLSEQLNLQQSPVRDLPFKPTGIGTTEQKYKQLLLMSLANPYHLGKNEIAQVEGFLQEWAQHSRLINPDDEDKGEAHFACCLNCDRAPVELNLIRTLESNVYRFLDTSDLTQHLRFLLTQAEDESSLNETASVKKVSQQSALYRQLIQSWDTREKRRFSRSTSAGGIDVSVGLNSTHYIIDESNKPPYEETAEESNDTEVDDFIDDTRNPLEISHTTFSIEPAASLADSGSHWGRHGQGHADTPRQSSNSNEQVIAEPSYNYYPWKTLNAGAGGFCLLWDHDKSSNAQIGEIVGIRESGNGLEDNWRIGVVRWMQYLRNQGLKLGIQILAPNAATVQSKLLKGRASKKQEYSCLSLPEIKSIQQPASILTPSLYYKVGDALILNDHGRMTSVQLTRLIENTGNYSRFQYAPINSVENNESGDRPEDQTSEWTISED